MIIESSVGLALWLIELIFGGLNFVSLPYNFLNILLDFLKFGAWVIGADLLSIVWTNISFWLTFKFSAGLLLFIWRLLPLT